MQFDAVLRAFSIESSDEGECTFVCPCCLGLVTCCRALDDEAQITCSGGCSAEEILGDGAENQGNAEKAEGVAETSGPDAEPVGDKSDHTEPAITSVRFEGNPTNGKLPNEIEAPWGRRIQQLAYALLKADPEYHKGHLTLDMVADQLQKECFAAIHSSLMNPEYAVYASPEGMSDERQWVLIRDACEIAWETFRQHDRNELILRNGKNELDIALNGLPEVPKPKKVGMVTVEEYLKMYAARAARPAIWEETLYSGSLNMLVGRPFSGKSSFATALLRAIDVGDMFMGRQCKHVHCGYLALERNGADVANCFAIWGLAKTVYFVDEIPAEMMAPDFIEEQIREHKLGFVVIDHLQHSVKIKQSGEYAEVSNVLMPYQEIAKKTGCCILALHHQAKPQKEDKLVTPSDDDPIEVMGSEAYRGASDTLIEATAFRGQYFLRAHTRTGTDISRMEIRIDFETGILTDHDPQSADIDGAIDKIRDYLFKSGSPQPEAEIRKNVEGKTRILSTALRMAVKRETLVRVGQGGAKDPFRYFIALTNVNNGREHEEH